MEWNQSLFSGLDSVVSIQHADEKHSQGYHYINKMTS